MDNYTELKYLLTRQTTLKQHAIKTGTIEDEDAWLAADHDLNEYIDRQEVNIEQIALMLLNEIELLEADCSGLREQAEDGLAVIRTQRHQVDCYIKDAERYRFLRNGPDGIDLSSADSMEDIDALIDYAMSKEQKY